MDIHKRAALVGMAALSISCAGPRAVPTLTLNDVLRPYGIALPRTPALSVVSQSRRAGPEKTFHTIVARDSDLHVIVMAIGPLEPAQADAYAGSRIMAIRTLYEDPASLYPGEGAHLSRCPKERKPRGVELPVLGRARPGLLANATEDFRFGACTDPELRRVGIYLPIYETETRTLLQFSVFESLARYRRESDAPLRAFLEGVEKPPPASPAP